jgi:hypothetical protein
LNNFIILSHIIEFFIHKSAHSNLLFITSVAIIHHDKIEYSYELSSIIFLIVSDVVLFVDKLIHLDKLMIITHFLRSFLFLIKKSPIN